MRHFSYIDTDSELQCVHTSRSLCNTLLDCPVLWRDIRIPFASLLSKRQELLGKYFSVISKHVVQICIHWDTSSGAQYLEFFEEYNFSRIWLLHIERVSSSEPQLMALMRYWPKLEDLNTGNFLNSCLNFLPMLPADMAHRDLTT
ncbi:hypothetical protein BJV82DRAFT_664479 [Fennellomyces sp. T-0311]|nr:hypothetical protein BJV82DRAFT_664479 [Fennellomyces sp. T-0311]